MLNYVQCFLVDAACLSLFDGCSLCDASTVEFGNVEVSKEGLSGVGINDVKAREEEVGDGKCVIEVIGFVDIVLNVICTGCYM